MKDSLIKIHPLALISPVLALSPVAAQTPTSKPLSAWDLRRQALAAEDAGHPQQSIDLLLRVLAIEPSDMRAMNTIAGLYGKMGRFTDELAWAKKAIATKPDFDLAYINLGNAYLYSGHPDEAEASFTTAMNLDPKSPLGPYSLGVVAEQKKNLAKAIELYQRSVQLDPRFENGYFNLAAMLANAKRYDEAIAALDRVLELNPRAKDAAAMKAQILRAKSSKP